MAINPGQIGQFYTVKQEDGTEKQYSLSQIGLDFACRNATFQAQCWPRMTDVDQWSV